MAAEALKFRKGLFANLAKQDIVPGTIYVTTDEQAMYVDVAAGKRIKISDTITFKTLGDLKNSPPPYSTTAFYYIEKDNALLRYAEKFDEEGNATGTYEWKQLNSTQDIDNVLDELTRRVGANETAITGLNSTVSGHTTAIGTANDAANADGSLYARIKKNAADIADNASAITGINTAIGDDSTADSIKGRLKAVEEKAADNTTEIGTLSTAVTGLGTRLSTAEGTITEHGTTLTGLRSDLGQATEDASGVGSAFARIAGLRTTIGDDSTAGSVKGRLTAVETKASDNATAINGINNSLVTIGNDITGVKGRLDTAEGDITSIKGRLQIAETNIGTLQTDLDTAEGKLDDVIAESAQNKTDIATVSGTVVEHGVTLGEHTTAIANNKKATEDNASAISALQTRAGNIESAASTLKGRVDGHDTAIGDLESRMQTAEGTLVAIPNTYATKEELGDVEDELRLELNTHILAANAMEYKGQVGSYTELTALTDVKVGYTYIVSAPFKNGDVQYYAGDLLVASGTENADGIIDGTINWNHVETGYIDSHEAKLTTGSDNSIVLTSHVATANSGDLGKVVFEAKAGTAATVAVTNSTTGAQPITTVTVGIEWDDFQ